MTALHKLQMFFVSSEKLFSFLRFKFLQLSLFFSTLSNSKVEMEVQDFFNVMNWLATSIKQDPQGEKEGRMEIQKFEYLENNKKYNCTGPPAFKSQKVGYQSNQKLLHHYQR